MTRSLNPLRWLSNSSTQSRISMVVGLLALVAAVSAILAINAAAQQQQDLAEIDADLRLLIEQTDARLALFQQETAVREVLLDPEQSQAALSSYLRRSGDFSDFLFRQQFQLEDEQLIQALWTDTENYQNLVSTAFDQAMAGSIDEARQTGLQQVAPALAQLDGRLSSLAAGEMQAINDRMNAIQQQIQANIQSGQVILVLLAVLVIWGIFTAVDISSPLASLTSAIVAFENNIYKPELLARHTRRGDELGQLAQAVDRMAQSITASNQSKEKFLTAASRFIPAQYLEFLEKDDITRVSLGDNIAAEMAVMFSDIRGFTTISEKMTAQENFDFVNEYLKLVSPIIQKHEGFIVKFLGDGMMAIFPYGVEDAVQAGIEKQAAVKAFNHTLATRALPPITVGIGIHTGAMMVGMIGEEARLQGDAFSDNVNLTSRLEGLNKFFGTSMIISEDTLRQIKPPVAFKLRYLGQAVVKGRVTPLGLYEVYEGLSETAVALKEAGKADFERGVELYSRGRFAEAHQAFTAVLDKAPNDRAAKVYLERCAEWLDRPAPAGWNGALVIDSK